MYILETLGTLMIMTIGLSEYVYYMVQSCTTTFELWKMLSDMYEKKVTATKIYLIQRLYNLHMKEFDSVKAHINEYESLNSQISAQGTTIKDELKAILLMSNLPPCGKLLSQLCATCRSML